MKRGLSIFISGLIGLVLAASPAHAPARAQAIALYVNSTIDAVDVAPGDGICATATGECTLRAAVQEANANPAVTGIEIPEGTFKLTLAGAGEDLAATGDLDIRGAYHLVASAGFLSAIIDAGALDRAFEVFPTAKLAVSGLTVRNGASSGDDGGGFLIHGELVMDGSRIADNHAGSGNGGGVYNLGSLGLSACLVENNDAYLGGGIFNLGYLELTGTEIRSNAAQGEGGGLYNRVSLTMTAGSVENNSAMTGGGIENDDTATMTLDGVRIAGNHAADVGGGAENAGTATMKNVTVEDNTAGLGGGVSNLGAGTDPYTSTTVLDITGSTFTRNTASDIGGGILNAFGQIQIEQTRMEKNSAPRGAGFANYVGSAALSLASIISNTAAGPGEGAGGGVYNFGEGYVWLEKSTIRDNLSSSGAGMFNEGSVVFMETSTVSNNRAQVDGGGIFNANVSALPSSAFDRLIRPRDSSGLQLGADAIAITNPGAVLCYSCTISGNTAVLEGGGIYNSGNGFLRETTVVLNSSQVGNAIANVAPGTLWARNSIVVSLSNGMTPACEGNGTYVSNGFNLENGNSCGFNTRWDLINTDPLLQPLSDNGGPTLTHALAAGSPAIDAGSNVGPDKTDQRGEPRFMDGRRDGGAECDIGAYEAAGALTSFEDTPGDHWASRHIEWLFGRGYIAGCGAEPRRYCPEQGMNRAEASVFVVRGVHTAGFLPPEPSTSAFVDVPITVPPVWYAKWVQQLREDGYTAGCLVDEVGNRSFCPDMPHTRAEAAVFFVRMLLGKEYEPPIPTSQTYDDVPIGEGAPWYSPWVYAADSQGVIWGCEDEENLQDFLYRPEAVLTRAEGACMMASALSRHP